MEGLAVSTYVHGVWNQGSLSVVSKSFSITLPSDSQQIIHYDSVATSRFVFLSNCSEFVILCCFVLNILLEMISTSLSSDSFYSLIGCWNVGHLLLLSSFIVCSLDIGPYTWASAQGREGDQNCCQVLRPSQVDSHNTPLCECAIHPYFLEASKYFFVSCISTERGYFWGEKMYLLYAEWASRGIHFPIWLEAKQQSIYN